VATSVTLTNLILDRYRTTTLAASPGDIDDARRPDGQAPGVQSFDAPSHPYRWVVLAGVWLLYAGFGVTAAGMAPLVSPITTELGLSHGEMGLVLGAWPFVYIGSAIPCGVLLDRVGPRKALFLAALLMAASGFARAASVDLATLFVAVGIFGLGGPLVSIGAPKLIALWFEGKDRGLAMGIYITGPAMGGIAALALTNSVAMPLAGGDWRLVLVASATVVAVSGLAWLLVCAHPASREVERRLAAEPRRDQLAVFRDLVRLPVVRILLAMSVGIFFLNHGLNNWLPEILRGGGLSAEAAGYWAAFSTAAGVVGSIVIPRLATPDRRLAILGGLILSAGVATVLLQAGEITAVALALACQGVARGSLMTVALLLLVEVREVGSRNAGSAGGLFFSCAEIGGVSGPVLIGLVHDWSGGFPAALAMVTGVCAVLLALLALLWREMRR
jgi:CP family cyanate transporter-like MFS transporter